MKQLKIKETATGIRVTDFSLVMGITTVLFLGMFFYLLLQLDDQGLLPASITDDVHIPFHSPEVATWFLLGIFGLFGSLIAYYATYTSVFFDAENHRVYWKRFSLFGLSWREFPRDEIADLSLEVTQRFQLKGYQDDYRLRIILKVNREKWPLSHARHVISPEELDDCRQEMKTLRQKLGFRPEPEPGEFL
ncbi:MAG: hypothetical protein KDA65_10020 [Planctomycetaceae bacterium]|nr:hypothetical protein [Planctomycetaceae bacterium]